MSGKDYGHGQPAPLGYDQLEEYDGVIKLLVQLRTPKLSKEFKPTVI